MRYWCFTQDQCRAAIDEWTAEMCDRPDSERPVGVRDLIEEFLSSDAARRHKLLKTDQEERS